MLAKVPKSDVTGVLRVVPDASGKIRVGNPVILTVSAVRRCRKYRVARSRGGSFPLGCVRAEAEQSKPDRQAAIKDSGVLRTTPAAAEQICALPARVYCNHTITDRSKL